MIRTLIVDDERLGRARIATLLRPHDDVHIVGQCKNGEEAVAAIDRLKPDIVFLDVQMPDIDGFGVLAQTDLSYGPFIVFATAYDQYAIKAFEVHAVDYLLKPFDEERFDEALNRARAQLQTRNSSEFSRKLTDLIRDHQQTANIAEEIFEIKDRGRVLSIQASDVLWIQADANYVNLQLQDVSYLHRITMGEIVTKLDTNRFLRIHRSYIVNVAHVKKVRYLNKNNEYEFTFRDGRRLVSSRSYRDKIAEYLQGTNLLR